jgi:hypothetical protein
MQTYTDIPAFLEYLAQGVEEGKYTKATFPKALDENEWSRLINDLNTGALGSNAPAVRDTAVHASLVRPFQFLGILPTKQAIDTFKYSDVSFGLAQRLDLIKMAKAHIKDFTATRH